MTDTASSILEIASLSKHFGGAQALDRLDFSVGRGEVHGLLGQNGSGKSTLIKILAGFHEPDEGARLRVADRDVALPLTPGQFRSLGIAFVHQHLGLSPHLSVLENFLLGRHATAARWYIPWAQEGRRAQELFQHYGLDIDPNQSVNSLSSVARAQLAVIRAFDQFEQFPGAPIRLLILDEPTPFLPARDVEHLFDLVRKLVADGASVIFVSHDIDEALTITDRITVLRDGRLVGTVDTHDVTKSELVKMIVGRAVDLDAMRPPVRSHGPVKVRIAGLSGASLRDVSMSLRAGEVLGLTGLIGSGYEDTVTLIYGAEQASAGTLTIDETDHEISRMTPHRAIDAGMVLIPADRLEEGIVPTLPISDNATLPLVDRWAGGLHVSSRRKRGVTTALNETYDVRPRDPGLLIGNLSGGNQQKVVLAKWFQTAPSLILLLEPTQGVDIGAREQVFHIIQTMTENGAAVLCASSDHEQLTAICDRVIVFARGTPVAEIAGSDISKAALARLSYGSLADAA